MLIEEIIKKLNLSILTNNVKPEKEIVGGFVGDLLSVVMGKAKENNIWITIQGHLNIVAVASLVGIPCIIISEGFEADKDTIDKANEEDIVILSSNKSSYEIVSELVRLGI